MNKEIISMDPGKTQDIGIVTWNVAGQNEMDAQRRAPATAATYAEMGGDIILLQEVAKNSLKLIRGARPDLEYYMGETHYEFHMHPIGYRDSRFTPLDEGVLWLPSTMGKRAASWVLFKDSEFKNPETNRSQELVVVNTQWDNISLEHRINSAKIILKFLEENFPNHFTVVGGDTNINDSQELKCHHRITEKYHKPLKLFKKAGFDDTWKVLHPRKPLPRTFYSWGRFEQPVDDPHTYNVDRIFKKNLQVLDSGTLPMRPRASDHKPYGAELRYLQNAPGGSDIPYR